MPVYSVIESKSTEENMSASNSALVKKHFSFLKV